jgi:hypothetical protein
MRTTRNTRPREVRSTVRLTRVVSAVELELGIGVQRLDVLLAHVVLGQKREVLQAVLAQLLDQVAVGEERGDGHRRVRARVQLLHHLRAPLRHGGRHLEVEPDPPTRSNTSSISVDEQPAHATSILTSTAQPLAGERVRASSHRRSSNRCRPDRKPLGRVPHFHTTPVQYLICEECPHTRLHKL